MLAGSTSWVATLLKQLMQCASHLQHIIDLMNCDKWWSAWRFRITVRVCVIIHSLTHALTDAASESSDVAASSELPALTEVQSKELERAYANGQFQDAAVLRELTHRLDLTDNQVQVRQMSNLDTFSVVFSSVRPFHPYNSSMAFVYVWGIISQSCCWKEKLYEVRLLPLTY